MVDEEGKAGVDGNGDEGEHLEGVPSTDLVRDSGPGDSTSQVAASHSHEVGGGKAGGDEGRHGVCEDVLDHRLGNGHESHPSCCQQSCRAPQKPELGGLQQVVNWHIGASSFGKSK